MRIAYRTRSAVEWQFVVGTNRPAALGQPETVTYVRSSGKPFQAIPVIVSGAADRFGFTDQEIAIAYGTPPLVVPKSYKFQPGE